MSYYYVDVRVLVECDTESEARDIVENIVDDARTHISSVQDFTFTDIKEESEE
mgnify:CR=1 FL=1|jgi:hypothetical protein